MKGCFFTGHRNVKITESLSNRLSITLKELINDGVTNFYAGGAIGWDILCEKTVIKLKRKYPIKLHLLLPCPPCEQTKRLKDSEKNDFYKILEAADSSEIISEEYTKDCMKKRNMRLAQSGEICLCYYNERRCRSGTAQTIRMAEKRGVNIINFFS